MKIIETPIDGCFLIENTLFGDDRGYFFESFNGKTFFEKTGLNIQFVQDNQSQSNYGVVRGLHFQKGAFAQAKLVRVLSGKVLDVVLDIRPSSKSFGKVFSVELSDNHLNQLFIPKGLAHGFSVISEKATFFYKCDSYYNKASEGGINPMDETLNIHWGIPKEMIILSDKDKEAIDWKDFQELPSSF